MGLIRRLRVLYYKSISDKRKYPRVPISVKVTNLKSGSFAYYQATNISVGGMFLKSDKPHPPGARLNIKFSLPDLGEVDIAADVVRNQPAGTPYPPGMGVKFRELPPGVLAAIEGFVKRKT